MKIITLPVQVAIVVCALSSISARVSAQDSRQLSDPSGFSVSLPNAFELVQKDRGHVAIEPGKRFVVVIKPHTYADFESVLADGPLERDGFAQVGEVQKLNAKDRAFRAASTDPNNRMIADAIVSFSPCGGGVLFVAFSEPEHAGLGRDAARSIVRTLRYRTPCAAPRSSWDAVLRGSHLKYASASNGYAEQIDIYLGTSGRFRFRSNASSMSINGSGLIGDEREGNWQITPGDILQLDFDDGQVNTYDITRRASNVVQLNSKRYLITR